MDVKDWTIALYPNEEEDEVTRLRRDEMEVNIAQRMMMIGFQPELVEEGNRDIRLFTKSHPLPSGLRRSTLPSYRTTGLSTHYTC